MPHSFSTFHILIVLLVPRNQSTNLYIGSKGNVTVGGVAIGCVAVGCVAVGRVLVGRVPVGRVPVIRVSIWYYYTQVYNVTFKNNDIAYMK